MSKLAKAQYTAKYHYDATARYKASGTLNEADAFEILDREVDALKAEVETRSDLLKWEKEHSTALALALKDARKIMRMVSESIQRLMRQVEESSGRNEGTYFAGEAASLVMDMCKELDFEFFKLSDPTALLKAHDKEREAKAWDEVCYHSMFTKHCVGCVERELRNIIKNVETPRGHSCSRVLDGLKEIAAALHPSTEAGKKK